MTHRFRWHLPVVTIPILAFAVACGSEGSLSPTSPSGAGGRSAPAGTTGAVITGTVSGMSSVTSSESDVAIAAATAPVTVTVVGTNISTTIDRAGRFQLNNVPAGDVQLKFAGTGLDATITLKGVEAGDRIDVRARLTDSSVRIEAVLREPRNGNDDHRDGDEFKGTVSGLSGTCPSITFTLNGATVKANSATRFEEGTCARVQNNRRVEVDGQRQTDGSIQATKIEIDD